MGNRRHLRCVGRPGPVGAALLLLLAAGLASAQTMAPAAPAAPAASALPAADATDATAPPPTALPATLNQRAFLQILALRNADVRFSRMGAQATARLRDGEAALYEPVLFGSVRQEGRDRQRTFEERLQNLQTAGTQVLDEFVNVREVGVRGKLPSGGELTASYKMTDRQNNLIALSQSPNEYSGALLLQLKQPLLRGAGRDVTETDRRVAELEHELALVQVQQQLAKAGADGLAVYWQAFKAQETVRHRQASMDNTRRLITDTQARVEAGRAPASSLLELRSVQLNRESELLRARQALLEAQARLLTTLDMPYEGGAAPALEPQWSDARPGRGDLREPQGAELDAALAAWSPLRSAELKLRQADVRLQFASNQTKPLVDLVISYSGTGLASRRGLANDLSRSAKYPDWFLGLNMELPTQGGQKSQAQYLAQAQRRDQAELEIASVRLGFTNDLQARWRDLQNAREVLDNTLADFALREKMEALERERYQLGTGSLNAVIQKESDLIDARLRLLENQVRFETALATWQYLNGALMRQAGISLN